MSVNTVDLSPLRYFQRRIEESDSSDEVISTRPKDLYEPKNASKFIRVLTVLAYILSVSLAAIMLSMYYIFLWDPAPSLHEPDAPLALRDHRETHQVAANLRLSPDTDRVTESTDSTVVLNEEVAYSQYPVNSMYEDDTSSTEMTTDTTLSFDPSTEMLFDSTSVPTKLSRILGIKRNHEATTKITNNRPKRYE